MDFGRTVLSFLLIATGTTAAYGQVTVADCAKLLIPDVTVIRRDVTVRATYLETITSESYESVKSNAGLATEFALFDIPIGVNVSYATFNNKRQAYFTQIGYSIILRTRRTT